MSPFLTDEVSLELSPSPSPSQGNTAPAPLNSHPKGAKKFVCKRFTEPGQKGKAYYYEKFNKHQ